jgi:hypothetical protein
LLETVPDHHVFPQLYPDPERPAAYVAADAAEDGDLAVEIVVVVVGAWIASRRDEGR